MRSQFWSLKYVCMLKAFFFNFAMIPINITCIFINHSKVIYRFTHTCTCNPRLHWTTVLHPCTCTHISLSPLSLFLFWFMYILIYSFIYLFMAAKIGEDIHVCAMIGTGPFLTWYSSKNKKLSSAERWSIWSIKSSTSIGGLLSV